MTRAFEDMLYLLSPKGIDSTYAVHHVFDVKEIYRLSNSQGVWTLVFPELEKYADLSQYTDGFVAAITVGLQRKVFQLHIISELEKAGYSCCLLKGAAVAALYPNPDYRISSDTDILIKPEAEQQIMKFLEEKGYSVTQRGINGHHFKAVHPVGGLLEGHVRLYSIPTEEIIFNGLQLYKEDHIRTEIEGIEVEQLGINDGLMYLTAHYIKHFVNEGGGVRQMLDLLVYMDHYKNELDFKSYEHILKQLGYDTLIESIKTIGAKYWGFNYPQTQPELAERILDDSEAGGIFGFDAKDRTGFYNEYCKLRSVNSLKDKYIMLCRSESLFIKRIFLSQERLINIGIKYAKHKGLMPIGWLHHLLLVLLRRIKGEKTVVHKKNYADRLKLMKDIGMIKNCDTEV